MVTPRFRPSLNIMRKAGELVFDRRSARARVDFWSLYPAVAIFFLVRSCRCFVYVLHARRSSFFYFCVSSLYKRIGYYYSSSVKNQLVVVTLHVIKKKKINIYIHVCCLGMSKYLNTTVVFPLYYIRITRIIGNRHTSDAGGGPQSSANVIVSATGEIKEMNRNGKFDTRRRRQFKECENARARCDDGREIHRFLI